MLLYLYSLFYLSPLSYLGRARFGFMLRTYECMGIIFLHRYLFSQFTILYCHWQNVLPTSLRTHLLTSLPTNQPPSFILLIMRTAARTTTAVASTRVTPVKPSGATDALSRRTCRKFLVPGGRGVSYFIYLVLSLSICMSCITILETLNLYATLSS